MSKINIKGELNNLTEQEKFSIDTMGILLDNKIKYIDNSVTVILEMKDDEIFLERSTNEYHISMDFSKDNITNGIYEIKTLGNFDLRVETKEIDIENNKIFIKYSMYINDVKQDFEYKIEYEER